jgi:exosortase
MSLEAGYSSHIVLLPFIAAYLVWSQRAVVFSDPSYSWVPGLIVWTVALIIGSCAFFVAPRTAPALVPLLTVLSTILLIVAGYLTFFGSETLRKSAFPLLLLFFMLPVPGFLVEKVIYFLQAGSAWLSEAMFSILGMPVFRDGFLMTVPGVTIEVAQECSGINSSIALFILMLLFAQETLKTNSRRAVLVLLIIPLSILKNAIRIVTLTVLATKVDPSFLTGRLHHQGGFVFFLITLVIAYPIWKWLRRSESHIDSASHFNMAAPSAAGDHS